jgi:hypothetical protein
MRSRWIAALAAAGLVAGGPVAAGPTASAAPSAPTAAGSTIDRPDDAVVLTGDQIPELNTTAANRVVGFRASNGTWAQIPVQVDERKAPTTAAIYDLPTTQTFYGSSIDIPVTAYADPTPSPVPTPTPPSTPTTSSRS